MPADSKGELHNTGLVEGATIDHIKSLPFFFSSSPKDKTPSRSLSTEEGEREKCY